MSAAARREAIGADCIAQQSGMIALSPAVRLSSPIVGQLLALLRPASYIVESMVPAVWIEHTTYRLQGAFLVTQGNGRHFP